MSSRKKPGGRVKKKPYAKPEVKQVQLRPEEAVLGNCKTTGFSGPFAINICVSVSPCSSQGS